MRGRMTEPMDVFLLLGQSNMAGRGKPADVPPMDHPRVDMFREGRWIPAKEPLHNDKPSIAGVGLAMSFAVALADTAPDRRIGLVPAAVGGTPLCRWLPGADLYTHAVTCAREALRACGKMRGILWHQGEGDTVNDHAAATYGDRLAGMILRLRSDLAVPDAPFIAGELGSFLAWHEPCRERFRIVNAGLHALRDHLPAYACASAAGLTDNGDRLHFDAPSLRTFGRRYAAAFISRQAL
jgi:hypothetical protein